MSKILIVEDDPEIAMLERDYLEIEGFETQVTDNGQMAITQAVTGDYRSEERRVGKECRSRG